MTHPLPPFDRVVLFAVAIEDYQNAAGRSRISPVSFARADAEALAQTVDDIYDGVVPVKPHILLDGSASLATFRSHAQQVISGLEATDLFIFYYAGHGCQIEGANRLTAWDSNPEMLGSTTVDLNDAIVTALRQSECQRALLFIDACAETIKGTASRSMIFSLDDAEIERELDASDYLAVFLSCSDGERSYSAPTLGHGIFTWHLLKALRGDEPKALQKDRWLTDATLRDWLSRAVRNFITTETQFSGTQTPRAILNTPQTFLIRHVPAPAAPARSLADLGLANLSVFLESVESGAVRNLKRFKRIGNSVPTSHSAAEQGFVQRLISPELETELEEFYNHAKQVMGFKRREGECRWDGGGGSADTPQFRYTIDCGLDPDDPSQWHISRKVELRQGWESSREDIATILGDLNLDRFVVTFHPRRASFDDVADALDDLATGGDRFEEYQSANRLYFRRDDMSLSFDFNVGTVILQIDRQSNLELAEKARTLSLGWTNPSPMLASSRKPRLKGN